MTDKTTGADRPDALAYAKITRCRQPAPSTQAGGCCPSACSGRIQAIRAMTWP